MSSPADRGPQTSARDLRRPAGDASATAAVPSVGTAGGPAAHGGAGNGASGNGGPGNGGGSNGGAVNGAARPGAARPAEDWSAPAAPPAAAARPAAGAPTAAVPLVGGAGGGRPAPASSTPSYRPAAGPAGAAGAPVPGRDPRAAAFAAGATTTLPPRPGERPVDAAVRPPAPAATRPPVRGATPPPARRAQLTLRRFNVWSVFKFSCMLAIALWLVWMIAIGILYGVLDGAGVVGSINTAWSTLQGDSTDAIIRSSQVLGIAAIVGVVYIVLFIALSSLFAVIYNLVSDFVGGVEVTLSERE